ncbi:MAG: DEAD/DEAH box helicase, partial [Phycisphaerae bacterium]
MPNTLQTTSSRDAVLKVVSQYWGFDVLRPHQEEAIRAGIEGRDSLVVLPTGGGKSLCYQTPPVVAGRTDVVISPLISLMKDQVDGLRACGYPAAALNTGMSAAEVRDAERAILDGGVRLIFAAPERVLSPPFMTLMRRVGVRSFAI